MREITMKRYFKVVRKAGDEEAAASSPRAEPDTASEAKKPRASNLSLNAPQGSAGPDASGQELPGVCAASASSLLPSAGQEQPAPEPPPWPEDSRGNGDAQCLNSGNPGPAIGEAEGDFASRQGQPAVKDTSENARVEGTAKGGEPCAQIESSRPTLVPASPRHPLRYTQSELRYCITPAHARRCAQEEHGAHCSFAGDRPGLSSQALQTWGRVLSRLASALPALLPATART